MFDDDTKLDDTFSERRTRPENKDELQAMQRVYPPNLPATHTWDYRWEDPTPEALAKNRYLLPELIRGPRELTLSEIAAKSKDFATLEHGQLRWLFDKHGVKALPLEPGKPKLEEVEGLRGALRAHVKAEQPKPAKAVQANKPPQVGAMVLPADVAGMDGAAIETEAAKIGAHDEYAKIVGKPLNVRRAWLAEKRGALQPAGA